jgi:hypothetical protein
MDELAKILEGWMMDAISFDKVEVKFNKWRGEPEGVYLKFQRCQSFDWRVHAFG